jgi:hypothetical protein
MSACLVEKPDEICPERGHGRRLVLHRDGGLCAIHQSTDVARGIAPAFGCTERWVAVDWCGPGDERNECYASVAAADKLIVSFAAK